jgi:cobalt-precorrin-5B (C1)-methyltransferase
MATSGYTLPVFAVAAAKAALLHLQDRPESETLKITLDLLPEVAEIEIEQVAKLSADSAMAISRSNPGDNLDLTRDMPLWSRVTLVPRGEEALILEGGEGVGKSATGEAAIYQYARRLFIANLTPLIPAAATAIVTVILPTGKQLATRTSNAAFGIVDGLSLLGTSGISVPLSAAEHLTELRQALRQTAATQRELVFCIGSNGYRVAADRGIPPETIVKTGNWLGGLLVEAGLCGATSVTLLGYQGKLIKLAGGIFNTSSHIADAKLEILAAAAIAVDGDVSVAKAILACQTADAAYHYLASIEFATAVFSHLSRLISQRSIAYVRKYANATIAVPVILFDRQGNVIATDMDYN